MPYGRVGGIHRASKHQHQSSTGRSSGSIGTRPLAAARPYRALAPVLERKQETRGETRTEVARVGGGNTTVSRYEQVERERRYEQVERERRHEEAESGSESMGQGPRGSVLERLKRVAAGEETGEAATFLRRKIDAMLPPGVSFIHPPTDPK